MVAMPLVGRESVESMRNVVLLPAPFGPSRPKISPFLTSKLMSSTAVNLPNFLVRFFTSIMLPLTVEIASYVNIIDCNILWQNISIP